MKKLQIVKKRTKCMKKSGNFPVVGIIAEYNPFHNGHAYQIARAKELSGADACIVVMSGDFVQRGAHSESRNRQGIHTLSCQSDRARFAERTRSGTELPESIAQTMRRH